jgi:hypothetical protein
MTKRKSVSKTPAKSRAKKPAPMVKAELDKSVAEDFDERQQMAEPGRHLLRKEVLDRYASTPKLAANDVDAAWEDSEGSESVGGHAPTPDQDRVDDLGEAAGLTYADDEPLNFAKVAERDNKRWELDPASAEDSDADEDVDDEEDEDEEDLDELMDEDDLEELGLSEGDEEETDEVVDEDDTATEAVLEADEDELDLADEDDLDDLDLLDDDDDDFDDDEDDD